MAGFDSNFTLRSISVQPLAKTGRRKKHEGFGGPDRPVKQSDKNLGNHLVRESVEKQGKLLVALLKKNAGRCSVEPLVEVLTRKPGQR
jgi:hypothetical protein